MKKHLVILGGGHAGSSAALVAAKQCHDLGKQDALQITVINESPCLTVRPRLYEYELKSTRVLLADFLTPVNVEVVIAKVIAIDFSKKAVTITDADKKTQLNYDALVLALGSQLVHPAITGIDQYTHNIDTYEAAKHFRETLRTHLEKQKTPCRIAILGGGITGIELATELPVTVAKMAEQSSTPLAPIEIYLLDRHDVATNISENAKNCVSDALTQAKVNIINHASITMIEKDAVIYNESEKLAADIIVSTLGLQANHLTKDLKLNKDALQRINVNSFLQIDNQPACFAAGDVAHAKPDAEHDPIMSCQQARPQGRYAGFNAVSYLFDAPMTAYSQPNYVTCVDLGQYGAIYMEGWDRRLSKYGAAAKVIKQHINQDRIYPPQTTDQQTLLAAGELEFTTPAKSLEEK